MNATTLLSISYLFRYKKCFNPICVEDYSSPVYNYSKTNINNNEILLNYYSLTQVIIFF